jgi:hypothetical protein
MRSPFNYATRRFARDVSNAYVRSRKRKNKMPPNNNEDEDQEGCILGCTLFAVIIILMFFAFVSCTH